MLDIAIIEFLENKKQDFLKKKIKPNTSEEDKLLFTQKANEKFLLENWLIGASSRAKQLSLTSHPAKFIHPNAKASSIIAHLPKKNDGLLRSGNVDVDLDIFGNAAALDVEKFLRLKLLDNQTILQHIEQESDLIKEQFHSIKQSFTQIKEGFLLIKKSDLNQTSGKLKQVYFPVSDDYHLLSILIPSGIIYKLKHKINQLRFSEENKILREELKKSAPNQITGKINEIFDLTSIGYGGTKPQNISTLNNQNGGVSILLSSMPPKLSKRKIQPPKHDFFNDCLWDNLFEQDFTNFHQILVHRKNNINIRDKRDDIVINSITKVKRLVDQIRSIGFWSDSDTYMNLDRWQKIWLDEQYANIREDIKQNLDYQIKAQSYFANWFIGHYKQAIKKNKLLGDDDIGHIKDVLKQEQELLK
ncbi:MAG: type I-F CRISPR-associated protein Csy1 [gamma proteobacterium symbiont of Taylorina sp.]|nr:type I-F CRISPR-associated protein Csy1 [gamma proteobacterium symbiont of Taylorina sp.]